MIDYIFDHLLEIIAIIAAVVIFFLQIRKKALSYAIITNSSVVSVSDNVKDNIRILYDGQVVPSVRLIEIRIRNSGSLPIKPEDYIKPLSVRTPNSRRLRSEVIDANSLGVFIETELSDQTEIILSKTLLNPKDFFDIKILLADGDRDFSIAGRIVGISKIQTSSNRRPLINFKLSTLVYLTIFYVLLIIGFVNEGYGIVEAIGYISGIFLLVGLFLALVRFLEAYDKRNET